MRSATTPKSLEDGKSGGGASALTIAEQTGAPGMSYGDFPKARELYGPQRSMAFCSATTCALQQAFEPAPEVRHVVTAVFHSAVSPLGMGSAGLCSASNAARQWFQMQEFVPSSQPAFAPAAAMAYGFATGVLMQAASRKPLTPVKLNASIASQTSPDARHAQPSHGSDGKQSPAAQ